MRLNGLAAAEMAMFTLRRTLWPMLSEIGCAVLSREGETMPEYGVMYAKPRKLTKADKIAINRAAQQMLVQEIEELEQRAFRLGLHVTARALNQAKNALGWEMAGNILAAGKASRGQRPRS